MITLTTPQLTFHLGNDAGGQPVEIAGHTFITGSEHTGKTRITRSLIAQALAAGATVLVIDPRKLKCDGFTAFEGDARVTIVTDGQEGAVSALVEVQAEILRRQAGIGGTDRILVVIDEAHAVVGRFNFDFDDRYYRGREDELELAVIGQRVLATVRSILDHGTAVGVTLILAGCNDNESYRYMRAGVDNLVLTARTSGNRSDTRYHDENLRYIADDSDHEAALASALASMDDGAGSIGLVRNCRTNAVVPFHASRE